MNRPAVVAALNFFFRRLGLFQGNLWSQASIRVKARPELLAAVEERLRQIDRRKFLRFDAFSEFAYGEIEDLFNRHSVSSSGVLRRSGRFGRSGDRRGLLFSLH